MTTPDRSRIYDLARRLSGDDEWVHCDATLGHWRTDGYEIRCNGLPKHAGDNHIGFVVGAGGACYVTWQYAKPRERWIDKVPEGRYG